MSQTARRRGCGWMEVPCHETVILTAIKLTSIHYWKWLPTLQTHLGECAVIREFVGEGPECLTTTLSTTVRETEISREMRASVALMWYEVGLMDIKGKQNRIEGLGLPTWGLENTKGDYIVSGWERAKNNNNHIDAVSQIKLWLIDPSSAPPSSPPHPQSWTNTSWSDM